MTIILESPAELATVTGKDLPVNLQSKLIKLSSLGVRFDSGPATWHLLGGLAAAVQEPPDGEGTPFA